MISPIGVGTQKKPNSASARQSLLPRLSISIMVLHHNGWARQRLSGGECAREVRIDHNDVDVVSRRTTMASRSSPRSLPAIAGKATVSCCSISMLRSSVGDTRLDEAATGRYRQAAVAY